MIKQLLRLLIKVCKNFRHALPKKLNKFVLFLLYGTFADRLKTRFISYLLCKLNIKLSSKPFISGHSYIHIINEFNSINKARCHSPILAQYIKTSDVKRFFIENREKLQSNMYIILTHGSDMPFSDDLAKYASHPNIMMWFAQNNSSSNPKVKSLPIGLEDRNRHCHGRISEIKSLAYKSIKIKKKTRIFYSFNIKTNPFERQAALLVLEKYPYAVRYNGVPNHYKKNLIHYKFVASPPGNGIDCHRTWEALYLGVIPIVKDKRFYSKFHNFPGLIVDEWSDILELSVDDLENIYVECTDRLKSFDLMKYNYWRDTFHQYSCNK